MKKKLPIGIDDFKRIREGNYYFFDKSKLIEDILKKGTGVLLFTRPRRFGKTLNMSMIKYFFDIENREKNKKLFDNLYISKTKYIEKQGKNPVIFISLKEIKNLSWNESLLSIKKLISKLYTELEYITEKLDFKEKERYLGLKNMENDVDLETSLQLLSIYLYKYYGEKVVLLIDEYDTPLINAYENNYYDEAVNFFRIFYGSSLKGNEYLEFAVMTGILKIVKEGIFSGLNNVAVYTVLDEEYSNCFGITEEEVEEALKEYELIRDKIDVRKWYNGYKFGENYMYNPWSIINYLDRKKLREYWVNTSNDNTIMRLIKNANTSMFKDLEKIFDGKSVEKIINMSSNVNNLRNSDEIWQLMLFSGYLTMEKEIERNVYTLKIPNYEVKTFFKDSFITETFNNKSSFREMIKALLEKNIKEYEYYLQEIILVSMSYYDNDKINEKPYHNLILGSMLYLDEKYDIKSNIEIGYGRTDMILTPKNKKEVGYIFEFKVAKNEEEMNKLGEEALKQIKEKKYYIEMKNKGIKEILHLGIVFYGKKVKVVYDEGY